MSTYSSDADGATLGIKDLKAVIETKVDVDENERTIQPSEYDDEGMVPEFTPEYSTGITLALAMAAVILSTFLIWLDTSILATAIPTITDEFNSTADIGWYISSYQLALSALGPTTGKLFTFMRNKWTFIFFLAIFELGALVCGLATSSKMLIAGRAVSGAGASGLYNGALTIVSASAPLQKRPSLTGCLMGFGQLGLIIGPLVGGALTEFTTWRWCFYINLPVGGLAVTMLALVRIPEQRAKPPFLKFLTMPGLARRLDVVGTAILTPAVIMLLLAFEFGGTKYAWQSPTVLGLFAGAAVVLAVFLLWEWRVAKADGIIPLFLFRNKVVVAACLTNTWLAAVVFLAASYMPIYFQSVQGASALMSGINLLPSIISQLLTSLLSGMAVSRFGYYMPWSILSAVLCSIGCGLVSTWSTTTGMAEWIGYQVILGIGRGAGIQMAMVAVQVALPDTQIALVMAVVVFVQGLGAALFVTIANTILVNSLVSEIGTRAPGLDPQEVLTAGATAFRQVVPAEQVDAVIRSYAISFDRVFYLALGASLVMCLTIWPLGWHDVRKKPQHNVPDEAEERSSTSELVVVEEKKKEEEEDKKKRKRKSEDSKA